MRRLSSMSDASIFDVGLSFWLPRDGGCSGGRGNMLELRLCDFTIAYKSQTYQSRVRTLSFLCGTER